MFDQLNPDALAAAEDREVLAAVEGWARAEAASAARRLAAIAELIDRRCGHDDDEIEDERALWSCDRWDAAAAEIGAALGISARRASSQMYLAQSLRERLPKVDALFREGRIGARLVSTISWRTHLVVDEVAMGAIDHAIAEAATEWGPLSDTRVERAIDTLVEEHDPGAREWFREAARGLDVQFGKPDDVTGTRSVWGRLYSTHAELIERRLTAMARAVCKDDPRTVGQRRAEAMGAVFAGADRIACHCGKPACPHPYGDSLKGSVVIHVVADAATADVAAGGRDGRKTTAKLQNPVGCEERENPRPPGRRAAVMADGSVIPAELLTDLIRNGATLVPLREPCADGQPEPGYRPSKALQRFVRCRDLICRFPGCDAPAEVCDIDHAIAYPAGPTHPSNLRCLCRRHHLLKTFWVGAEGWSDRQCPDGAIVWTAPSGQTYTTYPGSRLHFPDWDTSTAELPPPLPETIPGAEHSATPEDPATPKNKPTAENRGLQMPRRTRPRTADRAARIKNRRVQNDTS